MDFGARFSHFGFFVRDLEGMAGFYRELLGFVETDRGPLGDRDFIFLSKDPEEHHQLILISGLTKPPAEEIINQISFRLPDLETLLAFHAHLVARAVADIRPVNHGNAWSIYFRDPEGNRIETYVPSPWYVVQPCREPLDPALSAAAIRTRTEAWCRAQPSFQSAASFKAALAARIAAAQA